MRKLRDYDSELHELAERAKHLKARRVQQFGELVIASGADVLGAEQLAGALLAAVNVDAETREVWRVAGEQFFRATRHDAGSAARKSSSAAASEGSAQSADLSPDEA